MKTKTYALVDSLVADKSLSTDEYLQIIRDRAHIKDYVRDIAVQIQKEVYSNTIFVRALVEVSNYCRNDCYYCGIRKSNKKIQRYRLDPHTILDTAHRAYERGFRTLVLQGGEDPYFSGERTAQLVKEIKKYYTDMRITLSLGQKSHEDYQRFFDAGADRYLLRHETINPRHYSLLHPEGMTLESRLACLEDLRDIGFQPGSGFMVGSPYQTEEDLAKELKFYEEFKPDMCGIGPYLLHQDTPFKDKKDGDVEMTLFLLSLLRIIHPPVLLPATTALGTARESGRNLGILAGCNVLMPNLTPDSRGRDYKLYDHKIYTGLESAENIDDLRDEIAKLGYEIIVSPGDGPESI